MNIENPRQKAPEEFNGGEDQANYGSGGSLRRRKGRPQTDKEDNDEFHCSGRGVASSSSAAHSFTFSSPNDNRRVTFTYSRTGKTATLGQALFSLSVNNDVESSNMLRSRAQSQSSAVVAAAGGRAALSPPTSPGGRSTVSPGDRDRTTPTKRIAKTVSAPVSPPSSDPTPAADLALGITAFAERLQKLANVASPAADENQAPKNNVVEMECQKMVVVVESAAPTATGPESDDDDHSSGSIVLPAYGLDDSDGEEENVRPNATVSSSKQPRKQAWPRPSIPAGAAKNRRMSLPLGSSSSSSGHHHSSASAPSSPASSWARMNQKMQAVADKPSRSSSSSSSTSATSASSVQQPSSRSSNAFEFDPYYTEPSFAIVTMPSPPPRPSTPEPTSPPSPAEPAGPAYSPERNQSPPTEPPRNHRKRKWVHTPGDSASSSAANDENSTDKTNRHPKAPTSSAKVSRKHLVSRSGHPGGPVAKAPDYRSPVKKPSQTASSFTRTFLRKAYLKNQIAARERQLSNKMPVTYKKIKTKHTTSPDSPKPVASSPLAKKSSSSSSPPSSPLTTSAPKLPELKEGGCASVKKWLALPSRNRKFSDQQAYDMLRTARESLKNILNCQISQSMNKIRRKRLESQRDVLEEPIGASHARKASPERTKTPPMKTATAGGDEVNTEVERPKTTAAAAVTNTTKLNALAFVASESRIVVKLGPEDHVNVARDDDGDDLEVDIEEEEPVLKLSAEDVAKEDEEVGEKEKEKEGPVGKRSGEEDKQESEEDLGSPRMARLRKRRESASTTRPLPNNKPVSDSRSPTETERETKVSPPIDVPCSGRPSCSSSPSTRPDDPVTSPPNSDDEDEVFQVAEEGSQSGVGVFDFEEDGAEEFVEAME